MYWLFISTITYSISKVSNWFFFHYSLALLHVLNTHSFPGGDLFQSLFLITFLFECELCLLSHYWCFFTLKLIFFFFHLRVPGGGQAKLQGACTLSSGSTGRVDAGRCPLNDWSLELDCSSTQTALVAQASWGIAVDHVSHVSCFSCSFLPWLEWVHAGWDGEASQSPYSVIIWFVL